MKVLIACEYSGIVREAFAKLGHNAWSCDILPTEIPGNHYQCDVMEVLDLDWDLMIAHPPCTYLSKAGARWMFQPAGVLNQERYHKALKAKEFFLKLLNAPIDKICIENPMPLKIVELPLQTQIIQPYEYGNPFSKKTYLWLKNLDPLIPTKILKDYQPYLPSNTGFGKRKGQKFQYKSITSKESAKTFQGIADAMASQWGWTL